ncbi:hypothetical protein HanHA89_Chr05g0199941 [Helianthus annuus]|nr:hypothetical protein HanHA89_Chr05g0199941 [Helianthus annuus]
MILPLSAIIPNRVLPSRVKLPLPAIIYTIFPLLRVPYINHVGYDFLSCIGRFRDYQNSPIMNSVFALSTNVF